MMRHGFALRKDPTDQINGAYASKTLPVQCTQRPTLYKPGIITTTAVFALRQCPAQNSISRSQKGEGKKQSEIKSKEASFLHQLKSYSCPA